jgi:hypothetical protein
MNALFLAVVLTGQPGGVGPAQQKELVALRRKREIQDVDVVPKAQKERIKKELAILRKRHIGQPGYDKDGVLLVPEGYERPRPWRRLTAEEIQSADDSFEYTRIRESVRAGLITPTPEQRSLIKRLDAGNARHKVEMAMLKRAREIMAGGPEPENETPEQRRKRLIEDEKVLKFATDYEFKKREKERQRELDDEPVQVRDRRGHHYTIVRSELADALANGKVLDGEHPREELHAITTYRRVR